MAAPGLRQLAQRASVRHALLLMMVALAGVTLAAAAAADGAPPDAKTLLSKADRAAREKDYNKAVSLYSEALHAQEPKPLPRTYYQRFKAHLKLQKFRHALSDLDAAIALDPEYTMAKLQRANLKLTVGECAAATQDYQSVLKATPDKKDAVKRLPEAQACAQHIANAVSAERHRQWPRCVAELNEAMQPTRAASSTQLLMMRARCFTGEGKHHEALADTGKVIKIDKANLDAYEVRAAPTGYLL